MNSPAKRSFLSNLSFVFQLVWKLKKSTLAYMLLNAVSNALISLTFILFPKWIIDELATGKSLTKILAVLAGAGTLLFVCKSLAFWSQNRFTTEDVWFQSIIMSGEKFMTMDYRHTDDPEIMQLNARAEEITTNAGGGVMGTLSAVSDMLSFSVASAVSLVILFTLSPVLIAIFIALSVVSFMLNKRQNRRKFDNDNKASPAKRRLGYLFDFMTNYSFGKDLRLFQMHSYLNDTYRESMREVLSHNAENCRADRSIGVSTYLVSAFQELITYGCLVFGVLKRGVTIGSFTMYATATHEFCGAFLELIKTCSRLLKLCDEIGILRDFLELDEDSQTKNGFCTSNSFDDASATPGSTSTNSEADFSSEHDFQVRNGSGYETSWVELSDLSNEAGSGGRKGIRSQASTADGRKEAGIPQMSFELRFEHVSFQYPGQKQFALKDLSLTVFPNEKLAVVGENGAGKTTFTKLVMGLYRPTQGRILINGVDAASYDHAEYYKLFAPVFQEVEIYAMTLAENISMKPLRKTDTKRVEECLRLADAAQILDKLSNGIHTQLLKVITPDGADLSGGERQKLAIARALYKNAPFVVLDEPTSALDPIAEQLLYEKFNDLVSGRSAVFITHRLASVSFCDRVAVISQGSLLEYGTHDELMRQRGEYSSMYSLQAEAYREGAAFSVEGGVSLG